jgi:Uma2 family endonuclease
VIVSAQNGLRLGTTSDLYPDVVACRFRPDFYRRRGPTPADALLVLEIADSSLRYDLETKASIYARYNVVEYWVEDIPNKRLVVHRDPTPEGYRSVQTLTRDEKVRPVSFPDVEIAVSELLG